MAERDIQYTILKAWGAHPRLRLWRANVGAGWFAGGEPARKTDAGVYPVKFGVPGQADISGLIAPWGRRLEIECKTATGRQSAEQFRFQRVVETFGGLYLLARSVEDVDAVMNELGIHRRCTANIPGGQTDEQYSGVAEENGICRAHNRTGR